MKIEVKERNKSRRSNRRKEGKRKGERGGGELVILKSTRDLVCVALYIYLNIISQDS